MSTQIGIEEYVDINWEEYVDKNMEEYVNENVKGFAFLYHCMSVDD